jgi:transposase
MSCKELRRAGVLERVKSGELKLVNAAVMMGLSYRQTKRLAKRYREEGAKGLKHASAGRESNRRKPGKFRERVLWLVGKKYSGEEGERFGPTLTAGHLSRKLCLTRCSALQEFSHREPGCVRNLKKVLNGSDPRGCENSAANAPS